MTLTTFILSNIEVSDLLNLSVAKELTISGILFICIVWLYRELKATKERVETLVKEKEEDSKEETKRYYELVISLNKTLDENTRALQDIKKILDK